MGPLQVLRGGCLTYDAGFCVDVCDWLECLCALIMERLLVIFIVTVEGGGAVNGE